MSGVLTSPFYANLLGRYLTNDTYPLRTNMGEVMQNISSQQMFRPAAPGKSGAAPQACPKEAAGQHVGSVTLPGRGPGQGPSMMGRPATRSKGLP